MPTWPWCQCCQCCPPAWPKLVDNIGMLRAVEPQWVVVEGWIFCEGTPGRTGVRPRPEVRPRPGFLPFRRVWLEYKTNKNGSAMGIYSVTHPAHCNFLFVFLLDLPPALLIPEREKVPLRSEYTGQSGPEWGLIWHITQLNPTRALQDIYSFK